MNKETDIAAELEQLKKKQALLVRAIRISLSLILLTLAITCVQAALRIPTMADIFRDMMPGAALPFLTQWVLGHAGALLVTPLVFAALGLGLLVSSRESSRGLIAATVVMVILFLQWQVVLTAMQSPLNHLTSMIGEPPK